MIEVDVQPFKEPRGFIKLLQWLFAICAFAITVDYSGKYGFGLVCVPQSGEKPIAPAIAYNYAKYPFNLDHGQFTFNNVPATCPHPQISPIGNSQSESVFFVFTGVITFLYATGMILVHLVADKLYMDNKRFMLADFFITIILAVFWIAGSSAWAHGVSNVSSAMNAQSWLGPNCERSYTCKDFYYNSVSKLVISVLFGYINFVLWTGNIWFLYKETQAYLNAPIGGGNSPSNMPPSTTTSP